MGEVLAHRFELLEIIASGGAGDVWIAFDRAHDRPCAAKVCRQRDTPNLLRFVREQGVNFTHPHVLTPYGWAGNDSDVVIASPLVAGGTLTQALQDHGTFTPPLVAEVLMQIARGLHHVHAEGWIHRDVKPSNVLLEVTGMDRPHLRLTDFGSAVRESDIRLTHTGYLHGTQGYLPPEAYLLHDPTPSFDWFALGVLGLRLVTDFQPSAGILPLEVLHAAHTAEPLPEPLRRVLAGLLAEDPRERLAAANDLERALAPVAQQARTADTSFRFMCSSGERFEVFDQLDLEGILQENPEVPRRGFRHVAGSDHEVTPVDQPVEAPTRRFQGSAAPHYSPAPQGGAYAASPYAPSPAPAPQQGAPQQATKGRTKRGLGCGLLAPIALIVGGVAAVLSAIFLL